MSDKNPTLKDDEDGGATFYDVGEEESQEANEQAAEPKDDPVNPDEDDDDGDEDEGGGDSRVNAEQVEDVRERRRQERKERRERQRAARAAQDLEIQNLRNAVQTLTRQIQDLGGAVTTTQVASLDQQLAQAKAHLDEANRRHADAVNRGDGTAAAQALEYRDRAKAVIDDLGRQKQQRQQKPAQTAPQPSEAQRVAAANAAAWARANPWFDPNGSNPASQVAKAIDSQMMREGHNPAQPGYWQELNRRLRAAAEQNQQGGKKVDEDKGERRGPRVGGGSNTAPAGKNGGWKLSAARKSAMVEAGIWDDEQKRNAQIRAYMKFDRDNGSAR